MNVAGILFLSFFCAVGLADVIRFLLDCFYDVPQKEYRIVVLPVSGESEDIEFKLRRIRHRHAWKKSAQPRIYLIDLGMGSETRQIVQILQRETDGITVCSKADFAECLERDLGLQSR